MLDSILLDFVFLLSVHYFRFNQPRLQEATSLELREMFSYLVTKEFIWMIPLVSIDRTIEKSVLLPFELRMRPKRTKDPQLIPYFSKYIRCLSLTGSYKQFYCIISFDLLLVVLCDQLNKLCLLLLRSSSAVLI